MKKILTMILALIIMSSLSACSLNKAKDDNTDSNSKSLQNSNDTTEEDTDTSENDYSEEGDVGVSEDDYSEDYDTDTSEDNYSENYDNTEEYTSMSIDDVCVALQNEFNNSGLDCTVKHSVDYNNNDVIEIYCNSGVTKQEEQNAKNEMGSENFKNFMKSTLNESTNVQEVLDTEQILRNNGINAYIKLHATYSDATSLDLAVYTASTGWIIF